MEHSTLNKSTIQSDNFRNNSSLYSNLNSGDSGGKQPSKPSSIVFDYQTKCDFTKLKHVVSSKKMIKTNYKSLNFNMIDNQTGDCHKLIGSQENYDFAPSSHSQSSQISLYSMKEATYASVRDLHSFLCGLFKNEINKSYLNILVHVLTKRCFLEEVSGYRFIVQDLFCMSEQDLTEEYDSLFEVKKNENNYLHKQITSLKNENLSMKEILSNKDNRIRHLENDMKRFEEELTELKNLVLNRPLNTEIMEEVAPKEKGNKLLVSNKYEKLKERAGSSSLKRIETESATNLKQLLKLKPEFMRGKLLETRKSNNSKLKKDNSILNNLSTNTISMKLLPTEANLKPGSLLKIDYTKKDAIRSAGVNNSDLKKIRTATSKPKSVNLNMTEITKLSAIETDNPWNFNDEFLSHYNEFSPSWRKACDNMRSKNQK